MAREIIPFDEVDAYDLLLKIDASDGAAGAVVLGGPGAAGNGSRASPGAAAAPPPRPETMTDDGAEGNGQDQGDDNDAGNNGKMFLALSESQVTEIRSFLRGPDVDVGGCVRGRGRVRAWQGRAGRQAGFKWQEGVCEHASWLERAGGRA